MFALVNELRSLLNRPQPILLLAVGLLLLPALLTHLGLLALYGDEGIRSLVALEMGIAGNYVTPTMFGEFYYNKPPLYNWLLLAVFRLTGRTDEFIARLPTVFFLLAYVVTVWSFTKKRWQKIPLPAPSHASRPILHSQFSILTPFALLTCGRILFEDSRMALIDTSFSWVMYGLCMVVFTQGERKQYGRLFGRAYLLAAIGFLLKGLPAVVVLGIALLTYLFWAKKWRKLFSAAHLGGMAVFGALVGSYYVAYAHQNGLSEVFDTLFSESAKRTFVEHGWGKTVLHLFTFPLELVYHFLPWTVLVIFLFKKDLLQRIRQDRFITWNALIFITTILPYWISVEVYARYLLMHVPMMLTVFFHFYGQEKSVGTAAVRWVEGIFQGLCWLMVAASFAPLLWDAVADVPHLYWKTGFFIVSSALLTWLYRRWEAHRMLVFVVVMLVARMGFNWFVVPTRLSVDFNNEVRRTTLAAVEKMEGQPIFIYKNSLGFQPITGYYFTRETGQIMHKQDGDFDKNACYLMDTTIYTRPHTTLAKVRVMWQNGELAVVKIKGLKD